MITLNVIGLDKLIADIDRLPAMLKAEAAAVVENGAKTFVQLAKRDAPVRTTPVLKTGGTFGSNLKQMISYFPSGQLSFTVVSGAKYSPYLEWGTITKVSVPGELAEYALQFKGRGLKKNGGILPHPFFFKQTTPVKAQLEKQLALILKDAKL
jgi:HK97 gp10 family phage protein